MLHIDDFFSLDILVETEHTPTPTFLSLVGSDFTPEHICETFEESQMSAFLEEMGNIEVDCVF